MVQGSFLLKASWISNLDYTQQSLCAQELGAFVTHFPFSLGTNQCAEHGAN